MCLYRKHFLFRTEMFEASYIIWQRRRWPLTTANSRIPFSGATKSSFYWQLHTNTKSSILASAPRYAKCIGCFLKRPSVDKQYNVTATCFAHQWVGTYLLFVSQSNIRPQLRAELKKCAPLHTKVLFLLLPTTTSCKKRQNGSNIRQSLGCTESSQHSIPHYALLTFAFASIRWLYNQFPTLSIEL